MDSEFPSDPKPSPAIQSTSTERALAYGETDSPIALSGLPSDSFEQASTDNQTPAIPPDGQPIRVSDQFWKVDPQNILVERISGLIFASVLLFAALIGLAIFWFGQGGLEGGFNTVWFAVAIPVAVILLFLFVFAIVWPPMTYQRASWRLDAEGLEIRRGVLWRHRITVPLGRVQHADVSQGPLQRPFGVGTLTVHTAGTQHASIPLEGLTYSTAIELRDLIVGQKKDQHVV